MGSTAVDSLDTGGAPLWETVNASFPNGLFPEGLEYTIKGKIRKRLRDLGYRVTFPPGEEWQIVVECFAIAGLERLHRGFGENPWFWVVAWPSIFGAAAVDFWPEVGPAIERRSVASDAATAHLEAILIRTALGNADTPYALPACAMRGLKAIGQSALPAIPTVSTETDRSVLLSLPHAGNAAALRPGPRTLTLGGAWLYPALPSAAVHVAPEAVEVTTSSSAECSGEPCTSTTGAAQAAAEAPAAWAQAEAQAPAAPKAPTPPLAEEPAQMDQGVGVAYTACAKRAVATFPGGRCDGYLAPIAAGELLDVLYLGEVGTGDEDWAFARRTVAPQDASWLTDGWVLREVVPAAEHRRPVGDGPDAKPPPPAQPAAVAWASAPSRPDVGASAPAAAKAAPWRITPGDFAYHVNLQGQPGHVRAEPGPGGAVLDEPLPGAEQLAHGQRVRVTSLSGHWAKVAPDAGIGGWIPVEHLQLTPLPTAV